MHADLLNRYIYKEYIVDTPRGLGGSPPQVPPLGYLDGHAHKLG